MGVILSGSVLIMDVSPQKGNPFPYAAESDVLSDSHLSVRDNITPTNVLPEYPPPHLSADFPSLPTTMCIRACPPLAGSGGVRQHAGFPKLLVLTERAVRGSGLLFLY